MGEKIEEAFSVLFNLNIVFGFVTFTQAFKVLIFYPFSICIFGFAIFLYHLALKTCWINVKMKQKTDGLAKVYTFQKQRFQSDKKIEDIGYNEMEM